jgi:hypothetical protein
MSRREKEMITKSEIQDVEGIPYDHKHTQTIVLAGIVAIAFLMLFCFTLWLYGGGA